MHTSSVYVLPSNEAEPYRRDVIPEVPSAELVEVVIS